MSGPFQRIARRRADRPDDPGASPHAEPRDGDAPTQAMAPVELPSQPAAAPAAAAEPSAPAVPAAPTASQPTVPAQPASAPAQPASPPASAGAIEPPARPGFRERGRMRRRVRYLRKLRELQARDLGGLVFDLRRFDRKRDDLVARKLEQMRACDDELRALEGALGERRDVRDVREPGIGGTCPRCFAIHGSGDRFCASCGVALGGAVQGPARAPAAPPPAEPS